MQTKFWSAALVTVTVAWVWMMAIQFIQDDIRQRACYVTACEDRS